MTRACPSRSECRRRESGQHSTLARRLTDSHPEQASITLPDNRVDIAVAPVSERKHVRSGPHPQCIHHRNHVTSSHLISCGCESPRRVEIASPFNQPASSYLASPAPANCINQTSYIHTNIHSIYRRRTMAPTQPQPLDNAQQMAPSEQQPAVEMQAVTAQQPATNQPMSTSFHL